MTTTKRTSDAGRPTVRWSAKTVGRLDAMTPADVERNAAADPDNPPLDQPEFDAVTVARKVQAIREARGLTQAAFATTDRFAPGGLPPRTRCRLG